MPLAASSPDIVFLFAGAGLILYAASRAAVDALTPANDPSAGRMALAHWMPIAWSAVLATLIGHSEVAIGLVFATSVAVLSLDLGVLTILAPAIDSPPRRSRAWPFVLPATFVPLLAGFSGTLSALHALMMFLLGVAIFSVWRGSYRAEQKTLPFDRDGRTVRALQLTIAIGLGAVGAWIGLKGVMTAEARTRLASSGLIAGAVLAPLLALPMLGTGTIAASNGKMGAVADNLVAIVLLNLCVLLPIVVVCDYARNAVVIFHSGTKELGPIVDQLRAVPFPLGVWRLDCVLVMALGLMLLPISLGRWTLARAEGIALAFGYVAYLIASAAMAIRI